MGKGLFQRGKDPGTQKELCPWKGPASWLWFLSFGPPWSEALFIPIPKSAMESGLSDPSHWHEGAASPVAEPAWPELLQVTFQQGAGSPAQPLTFGPGGP